MRKLVIRRTAAALACGLTMTLSACATSTGPGAEVVAGAPDLGLLLDRQGVSEAAVALVEADGKIILVDGLANGGRSLAILIGERLVTVPGEPLLGVQVAVWNDLVIIVGDRCPDYDGEAAEGWASVDCTRDKGKPLMTSGIVAVLDPASGSFSIVAENLPTDGVVSALVDDHLLLNGGATAVDLKSGDISNLGLSVPSMCRAVDGLLGIELDSGDSEEAPSVDVVEVPDRWPAEPRELDSANVAAELAAPLGCGPSGPLIVTQDGGHSVVRVVVNSDGGADLRTFADSVDTNGSFSGVVDSTGNWVVLQRFDPESDRRTEGRTLVLSDGGGWRTIRFEHTPTLQSRHTLMMPDGDLLMVVEDGDGWLLELGAST